MAKKKKERDPEVEAIGRRVRMTRQEPEEAGHRRNRRKARQIRMHRSRMLQGSSPRQLIMKKSSRCLTGLWRQRKIRH